MFRSFYKLSLPVLVLIIFGLQSILYSPDGYAQGLMKISDDIGGSSGATSQSQDSGGNSTTLLIIGGVIIAGFLVYKLVINKDEPIKDEKQDTTSSQSLILRNNNDLASNVFSENVRKLQEIPVNLYVGFQNVDPYLSGRKFIMGITCKF